MFNYLSIASLRCYAVTPQLSHEDKGLDAPPQKDEDPDGFKLLQSPDPLERAAKILGPLLSLIPDNIDVWFVHYDISIRRSKPQCTYQKI